VSSQAEFLARVRQALDKQGTAAAGRELQSQAHPVMRQAEPGLHTHPQGERAALIMRFQEQLSAVGGVVVCVPTAAAATAYIRQLAQEKQARLVVRWPAPIFTALEVDAALQEAGIMVRVAAPPGDVAAGHVSGAPLGGQALREVLAAADIGLSSVDCAIAETGTLALSALPGQMRSVSLLPPVHIAVVRAEQIVASMADYLGRLQATGPQIQERLTSCISFITGPSRTGDIELTLTVGVHGPGALHVVVLDETPAC
jgi:L-lactate dehydrogenase complex protein LldG